MSRAITAKQRDVLTLIHRSIVTRGFPPTLRQIGEAIGVESTNGVTDHLRALERRELITRDGTSRGIALTDAGFALLQEPTPAEMREAVRRAERYHGLLIRAWALLTQTTPMAPLLGDIRDELGSSVVEAKTEA